MMIVMKEDATKEQIDAVVERVESVGRHGPRLRGRGADRGRRDRRP